MDQPELLVKRYKKVNCLSITLSIVCLFSCVCGCVCKFGFGANLDSVGRPQGREICQYKLVVFALYSISLFSVGQAGVCPPKHREGIQ